ncbi:MAG: T9SS type A sorting domain-containing protein [Bacteroidota bacterium]
MKKNLFIITLVFLGWTGVGLSQDIPFPQNNAIWKEEHITIAGPLFKHFALCGDTVIGGNTYSQVLELQVDASGQVTGQIYRGGIRSEDGVVSFLPDYNFPEHILFDFDLEEGDVINLYPWYSNFTVARTVDSVKTQMIAGQMRRVIYFHPGYNGAPVERWMEGIGSSYGLLGRSFDPGGDIGFNLLCFKHEDTLFNLSTIACEMPELENCGTLNDTDEPVAQVGFEVYPNPSTGDFFVKMAGERAGEPWWLKIFAADGRLKMEVLTNDLEVKIPGKELEPGVYFGSVEGFGTFKIIIIE